MKTKSVNWKLKQLQQIANGERRIKEAAKIAADYWFTFSLIGTIWKKK